MYHAILVQAFIKKTMHNAPQVFISNYNCQIFMSMKTHITRSKTHKTQETSQRMNQVFSIRKSNVSKTERPHIWLMTTSRLSPTQTWFLNNRQWQERLVLIGSQESTTQQLSHSKNALSLSLIHIYTLTQIRPHHGC